MSEINYSLLPQLALITEVDAPLLLAITDDLSSSSSRIIYNQIVDKDSVVTALLEEGLVWEYLAFSALQNEEPLPLSAGSLYSLNDTPVYLIMMSALLSEETSEIISPINNITFNADNVSLFSNFFLSNADSELIPVQLNDVASFNYLCAGTTISVPTPVFEEVPGEETPDDPDALDGTLLLISNNDTQFNSSSNLLKKSVNNKGNEYSYTETETDYEFCLAARKELGSPTINSTGCVEYLGRFAIEVNGVVVPYAFKADSLPLFFNESNPENTYGIIFEQCEEPPTDIPCIPSDPLRLSERYGPIGTAYVLEYSVNNSDIQEYRVPQEMVNYSKSDVFMDFVYTALSGYAVDGGGGSVAVFQRASGGGGLYPGNGSMGSLPVTLTLFRSTTYASDEDLFSVFFNLEEMADKMEIRSCGYQNFMGY